MQKKTIDFLIIGQGLAGSILAWELMEAGYTVRIVDNNHKTSSSKVAAGILNPVTGKRLAKSWGVDVFLPIAKYFYQNIEKTLEIDCFKELDILRFIKNEKELEIFQKRAQDPEFSPYLGGFHQPASLGPNIKDPLGSFTIKQAAILNTPNFLSALRVFFLEKEVLVEAEFHHADIDLQPNTIGYKGITAKRCIFCEGYKAMDNPFFADIKWAHAKGEILTLRPSERLPETILNLGKWISPLKDNTFRAGSSYDWDNLNEVPTPSAKAEILEGLSHFINTSFEVIDHQAGVRPCTQDAKPIIQSHPKYPQLTLFNGFASKGSLMIPYFAKEFIESLKILT